MPLVLLEKRKGIATIRLNRPEARNALNPDLLDELDEAIRDAGSDSSVKVVVLAGDERAFSAGADLKAVIGLFDVWPRYVDFLHRLHDVFCAIEEMPLPTIAQVRGYALAGGLELILCCDLAIASDQARIGDQHANYGLMAGAGGIPRLVRRIGLQRALEIFYTGRWLSGQEAAQLGIVLRSVPDERLAEEVDQLAREIATKSRTGLRYMKRAARAGLDLPLEGALRAEQAALIEFFTSSEDPRRGLEAFITKQAPNFSDED
jgi:enoyl-CoA hydratase/carnithine racemase